MEQGEGMKRQSQINQAELRITDGPNDRFANGFSFGLPAPSPSDRLVDSDTMIRKPSQKNTNKVTGVDTPNYYFRR